MKILKNIKPLDNFRLECVFSDGNDTVSELTEIVDLGRYEEETFTTFGDDQSLFNAPLDYDV